MIELVRQVNNLDKAGKDNREATILIVDDWEINVDILEAILKDLGYKTYTAMSAKAATEILNDKLPQLVLLDIMMPDINGYEFCQMLKGNPLTRDIPVIFVSAAESDEEREHAFESGGVDFIRKPFDVTEIKTRVSTHLRIFYLRQELEENNRKLSRTINEQRKIIFDEKKRILENIAVYYGEDSLEEDEYVSKNARMLAQALNFSDEYENKISSAFVDGVEIAGFVRKIDPKIFEIFFAKEDDDVAVKAVSDVIYHMNEKFDETHDIPLSARIVAITDGFQEYIKSGDLKEEALRKMKEENGNRYDPYLLEIFTKLEKQIKS